MDLLLGHCVCSLVQAQVGDTIHVSHERVAKDVSDLNETTSISEALHLLTPVADFTPVILLVNWIQYPAKSLLLAVKRLGGIQPINPIRGRL